MGVIQKLIDKVRGKSFEVETGGFEILKRIFGSQFTTTRMLEQYEKSLYVFACASKIAEKVAAVDFNLYKIINSNGDVKEMAIHPALDLLYKVNPFQTRSRFFRITVINLKLAGDAFWYKVRNNSGKVVELWNLRPDFVEIIKDPTDYIKGYRFTKSDGQTVNLAPQDVVHFSTPTPLEEYYGVSPIKSAQIRVQTEELASTYQRDFFLNNARPDAMLKFPNALHASRKEQIRDEWEDRHKGRGKNSKIAILEQGLEYQQISISQKEMDFIESMKFTRDDILVAFHTPKPIVAITDDVNRANAETAMYIFLSETIKPLVEMMIEEINEMMIIPDFGEDLYLDFVDPTPENREQKINEYNLGVNKWLLVNEIRQKENLPPIDGGWEIWQSLANVPTGGLTKSAGMSREQIMQKRFEYEKKTNQAEEIRKKKIFRGRKELLKRFIIVETLREQAKKIAVKKKTEDEGQKETKPLINKELRQEYAKMVLKQVDSRAQKLKSGMIEQSKKQKDKLVSMLQNTNLEKGLGKDAKEKIKDFYKGENKVVSEFVFPFIEEYVRNAGLETMLLVNPDKDFQMTEKIRKAVEKRAEKFGLQVNDTTRDKITRAVSDGLEAGEGMTAISDRISNVYNEFSTYRADLISRTESTAANNEGFLEAYKQSDVATHKEWIATIDDRTRDEHLMLDGEIVKTNESFSNGLMYPQEPNCRCVIGPAFEE